jgi:hypothetical protein
MHEHPFGPAGVESPIVETKRLCMAATHQLSNRLKHSKARPAKIE